MTAPKPYCSTASSGVVQGHVYEFGHANEDKLHIYLRLWKVKEEIVEGVRDSFGNDHLRDELVCNIPLTQEDAETMARAFHSAEAALIYEINKAADKELRRLKRGGA